MFLLFKFIWTMIARSFLAAWPKYPDTYVYFSLLDAESAVFSLDRLLIGGLYLEKWTMTLRVEVSQCSDIPPALRALCQPAPINPRDGL